MQPQFLVDELNSLRTSISVSAELTPKDKKPLTSMIDAVMDDLALAGAGKGGAIFAAQGKLNAVANKVQALENSDRLSVETGAEWIAKAQLMSDLIGLMTPNPL